MPPAAQNLDPEYAGISEGEIQAYEKSPAAAEKSQAASDALFEAAARQSQQELATAPRGVDDQIFEAALRQSQEELKSPAQKIAEATLGRMAIPAELGVRAATNILGMVGAAAQTGAAFQQQFGEAPSLQGKSIDQVKATRADMQAQLGHMNQIVDGLMKSGAPDDQQIYAYNSRINSFEARIKEADSIIASGRPSGIESPMISPIGAMWREIGRRASAPALQRQFEQVFPSNQDFRNSIFGQGANLAVDLGTGALLGAAGGPLAVTGFVASQMGQQVYQAKKDAGASDEEAERASAFTSLASAATMGRANETLDFLSKSLAGMTAKQGIQAIIRAEAPSVTRRVVRGAVSAGATAAEFGAMDWEQRAIGQLQGYDPNHPLDHMNWYNILLGALLGGWHGIISQDPRLAREVKPDISTRTKEAQPPPLPPEVQPRAEPTPPPLPTAVTVTPKEDPKEAWNKFVGETTGRVAMPGPYGFELGVGREPVPQVARPVTEARPTLALGAPPAAEDVTRGAGQDLQGQNILFSNRLTERTGLTHEEAGHLLRAAQKIAEDPDYVPNEAESAALNKLGTLSPDQWKQWEVAHGNQTGSDYRAALLDLNKNRGVEEVRPWREKAAPPAAEVPRETVTVPSTETIARQGETTPVVPTPAAETPIQAWRRQYIAGLDPEARARFERQSPEDQEQYLRHAESVSRAYEATRRPEEVPAPVAPAPPWYQQAEEPAATRLQISGREPVDRPVSQDDVKREVQTAQADMGMHDNLIYHPTVEHLPDHVKDGLSPEERNSTAQIVTDHKLGNVHVIGDRFSTLNELRRAIIEEALPYRYRNVTKLDVKHDPFDRDMGTYDHIADRPQLNTHALLGADRPYAEAARTAMEEVNVHQGISRLLGPRWGRAYVNAMDAVQSQFDRLDLNNILAQKKGYANLEDMAKAYLDKRYTANWRNDPALAHKMTEELIGSYSRTFATPEELAANGPTWYQNALRGIQNGIRRYLGLEVTPYDVQSLLHDSAAALREAKYAEPSDFHPVGDQAKADMQDFKMSNRMPEEGAPGEAERADIGTELVRGRIAELQKSLQRGQQLRTQPLRLAMQTKRSIQERLNFLHTWPAIIDHEGHLEVMQTALDMFNQDFGGDPNRAMQYIIDHQIPGARNAFLTEVTGRQTADKIDALRAAGDNEQANYLAARLDRMNAIRAEDPTEMARGLAAQAVLTKDGSAEVAQHKKATNTTQRNEVSRPARFNDKDKIDKGKDAVDSATQDAAKKLTDRVGRDLKDIGTRFGTTMSVPEQYTQDLVDRIHDAIFKTNVGFGAQDTPALQRVYDTFRQQIQQIIRERPAGVPTKQLELKARPKATDTLRTIIDNYPYYKQAWSRTMDMLYTENPDLAQRFAGAIEEPVGETLANKLAAQQGTDLSDLVYKHFSTTDRLNTDLATKVVNELGIHGDIAQRMSLLLQNRFSDIVRDEQQDKLASILKSVGGTKAPAKTELERLVDHIVIGGLDSNEWLNLVAPRFGIEHYDDAKIDALRAAGDYMARLRDDGLGGSAIAQKVRADIADLTKLHDDPLITKTFKYLNDVYASSILTNPLTHIPYWLQGLMVQGWDTGVQGIRAAVKTRDPAVLIGMIPQGIAGYARGLREFGAVMSGLRAPETFLPEARGMARPRTPMEASAERFRTVAPGTPIEEAQRIANNYRYVRNFLEGVANLMTRGPQYAVHYANMRALMDEKGLSPQAAHEAASEVVLGTKATRDKAIADAKDIAERYGLTDQQRTMLEGELADEYKTTRDPADSSLANATTEELREAATRAYDTAIRGSLRGDVHGTWGQVSRGLLAFANDHVWARPFAEFLKVPFNLINELSAWTPLGMTRSAIDLVPSDTPVLGALLRELPFTRGGIESYLGGHIPRIAKAIETGDISQAQLRDLAWNQMSKGLVGTSISSLLWMYMRSQIGNPNPLIRFTYQGPADYGQQQIERQKGWQRDSVMIGGKWYSYENTPWRMLLAGLGAYEDHLRYDKQLPDVVTNEAYAAQRALFGGMTSAFGSPLQGLDALMNAMTQFNATGTQRELTSFATQMVGSLATMPFGGAITRSAWRLMDPTEREGNALWEKGARYIPVVSTMTLQPKLNVFGQPMSSSPLHNLPGPLYSPGGGLLGTGLWKEVNNDDPVWNYLAAHPGLRLSMPGNTSSAGLVKMTPDEIYQYHLARGPFLHKMLERAFSDPHFAAQPEEVQNQIIKRVFEPSANKYGKTAVMEYRRTHPVTPERLREAMTARGRMQAIELERQSQAAPLAPVVEPPAQESE